MVLVDPATLPQVIEAATVSALGDQLTDVANTVTTSFSDAHDRWFGLRSVFDVAGAEGIHFVLDRPNTDASEHARSLHDARNVLWNAASVTLPDLKARRDELAARIITVNAEWDAAESAYASADQVFWSHWRDDRDSSATAEARTDRTAAARDRTTASDAGDTLRDDITRFRSDLDAGEEMIASQLAAISGGTDVFGAWGEPVRTSQTYWGFVQSPYPGAPSSIVPTQTLAQRLEAALSAGVATRIGWLGTASEADVVSWMNAHPDFASAVGFVDPERAARLWSSLAADSEAGVSEPWATGPLAQLFALAPLAVGNLNGAPASQRNLFTREGLARLLADDDLDDDTRDKLESLSRMVTDDSDVVLLSVFLDSDGAPRASVAWGDVDTADQITTMSHGISTDLGSLGPWGNSARDLRESLGEQFQVDGHGTQTAVVLFMEWDSGSGTTVQGIDLPDAGASRFAQLLGGFAQTNPDAQRNVVLHSLGTTMGAQAIADNPGLVDNAWFFGSAGLAPEAESQLASQIEERELIVRATHASEDWVAPLGRTDLLSDHPVDPRTVQGVLEFGSDGGYVPGYGSSGATGDPTEGHNAQESGEVLYWGIDGWTTGLDGSPVPKFDSVSTGYLDPTAQSFMELVVGLSDAAELVEVP